MLFAIMEGLAMINWISRLATLSCLAACSLTSASSAGSFSVNDPTLAAPKIIVAPGSFVCVSATVPQALWPDPLDSYDGPGLSGWFVNSFRKKFIEIGKLGKATRFRTNENDIDPICNNESSIYVDLYYISKINSDLIYYKMRVHEGKIARNFSGSINVEEEVSSGRVEVKFGESRIKKVILNNITARATEVFNNVFIVK